MFTVPEQFSETAKAHFEAQLALINTLTKKAFESAEKMVELNLNAAKSTISESLEKSLELTTVKDPQAFLEAASANAKPSAEQALAYGRTLSSLLTEQQTEFAKTAEALVTDTSRKLSELVDELSKNAPAGSESAIAILKSVIANANAGFEQLTRNTKQAVDALQANLDATTTQFVQAAEKTAKPSRKK